MKAFKKQSLLILAAVVAVTVAGIGCKEKTAGDKMKDAASDTKDAVKDAADKTGDAMKDAANKTGDAAKDAYNATKEAVTNAVDNMTNTNK